MPLKVPSFLSDSRCFQGTLLLANVIFFIILYHHLSIIKNELHVTQEKLSEQQMTSWTHRSSKDMLITSTASTSTITGETTTVGVIALNTSTVTDTATEGISTLSADLLEEIEIARSYSDILIHKSNWSSQGINVDCAKRLELPITKLYVRESYTQNCYDYKQCKDTVLYKEKFFKELGYPRIEYNFIIGGDGSIFEGLSWYCSEDFYKIPERKYILVSFTGDTEERIQHEKYDHEINNRQYNSLKLFIMANLINGNLSPSYELLPYCCAYIKNNPGIWVNRNLTSFENFNGSYCLENGKCKGT